MRSYRILRELKIVVKKSNRDIIVIDLVRYDSMTEVLWPMSNCAHVPPRNV